MNIEIDKDSGFCFGVINAIKLAEKTLEENETLYCLGDIVHNNKEVERLESHGLVSIDKTMFSQLKDCKVLIRAHGEPPETYEIAKKNNITLLDGTCPVVLKLQERIKKSYHKHNTQIVIFGKIGHAEVEGLVGQTNDTAIVIEKLEDIEKIDFTKPIHLFSQTTRDKKTYKQLAQIIEDQIQQHKGVLDKFSCTNSICGQVSNRVPKLKDFCRKYDMILFVSGKKSSNGKMLFEICKKENQQAYLISDTEDIQTNWFSKVESVGICGATSTPRWLMEEVAKYIKETS